MAKYDTESFIDLCKKVHNDYYDYSKVEYTGCFNKVCIICPVHGEFWQAPAGHQRGAGCRACSIQRKFENDRSERSAKFFDRCEMLYGDKFDYSKTEYISVNSEIAVTCKIHGDFLTTPHLHTDKKHGGCRACYLEESGARGRRSDDVVWQEMLKAQAKHTNMTLLEYIGGAYINRRTEVLVECSEHGKFTKTVGALSIGGGCMKCSARARPTRTRKTYTKSHEFANIYLLRIKVGDEDFVKVGLSTDVTRRVKQIQNDLPNAEISVVQSLKLRSGVAWDMEAMIHRAKHIPRYEPANWFGGATECYTADQEQYLTEVFERIQNKHGGVNETS